MQPYDSEPQQCAVLDTLVAVSCRHLTRGGYDYSSVLGSLAPSLEALSIRRFPAIAQEPSRQIKFLLFSLAERWTHSSWLAVWVPGSGRAAAGLRPLRRARQEWELSVFLTCDFSLLQDLPISSRPCVLGDRQIPMATVPWATVCPFPSKGIFILDDHSLEYFSGFCTLYSWLLRLKFGVILIISLLRLKYPSRIFMVTWASWKCLKYLEQELAHVKH